MSWMQHSETPFANAQKAIIDPSGWADQFRDGQKLRQEYDARQQTKALNELMGIQDFNERIAKARTHKYAGALVPELQKYEEARQKAALDNLGASADIGKTYGETSKLNAESGKIGAETTGLVRENVAGIQNDISALAVTQDPKLFALGLGEMTRQGLITPERTDMMLKMIVSDPKNAAKVMQSMVMANPELAKLFKPEVEYTNLGNRVESQVYDPLANTVTGKGGYNIGQSPDNFADNKGRYEVAGLNNDSREAIADLQSRTSIQNTNANNASREGIASDAQAISWYNAKTGASIAQQNADTNLIKANKTNTTTTADGQPVRKLDSKEKGRILEINEAINADKSVLSTLDQMLNLVDNSYSGAGASLRAKAISGIGLSGEAADNTVLYDNLATSQALAQLKATFGAAPTEGERKILMDIQASANKTPKQKIAIIRSAVNAVRVRAAYRKAEREGIQTGRYLIPSGSSKSSSKSTPAQGNDKGASIIGGILGSK